MGDCSEIITGGTPTTSISEYWFPKEIPWMSSGEVNKLRIKNTDTKISMKGLQNSNAKWLPENSILIALAGQGKTRGMVAINSIPLTTNQSIAGIVTNQDLYYEFLFQYLISQYEALRTMSSGGDIRGGLNKTIIANIEFYCPTLPEQQAIGEFFKQLDDTIAFHQRTQKKYQNLKKSYLEKMFAKINYAWKQRKLKDISQKVLEKNLNMEFLETFTNSAELGIISQRDFFDKDIANVNNLSGYYIVRNNDFVYNPRISNFAPVGPIKRNKLGRSGAMSPLYYVFRVCDEIDFAFLETYFSSTKWHSFMKENGDTGARADRLSIKDNVFIEMPIYFPTLPEQQAIGEFFKQLDDTIAFHQRELEKYQQLKQVLLDQLFV